MKNTITTRRKRRRSLTPWELPTLLVPMHEYKQPEQQVKLKDRPHFPAILSFVYRNRFVVASQVQRRFANTLKSDRTARRHLVEMQALGYVDVVPTRAVGPLWPKVFQVTPRGARRLRQLVAESNGSGQVIRLDRKRTGGFAAHFVVHEVLVTEFLLSLWLTVKRRDDLELLRMERRSLAGDRGFDVRIGRRGTRVNPDGMFLHRQKNRGMMVSFVEIDAGTMSLQQIETKYRRYEAWAASARGRDFLIDAYREHGARNARPSFRILVVGGSMKSHDDWGRMEKLLEIGGEFGIIRETGWFTAMAGMREHQFDERPLDAAIWRRFGETVGRRLFGGRGTNGNG